MTTPDLLFDTDIPWRLRPLPAAQATPCDPSTPDVLGLVFADVIALEAHVASLQADMQRYRELTQVALDRVVTLTALVRKRDARIAEQEQHLRVLLKWRATDDGPDANTGGGDELAGGARDRLPPHGARPRDSV